MQIEAKKIYQQIFNKQLSSQCHDSLKRKYKNRIAIHKKYIKWEMKGFSLKFLGSNIVELAQNKYKLQIIFN